MVHLVVHQKQFNPCDLATFSIVIGNFKKSTVCFHILLMANFSFAQFLHKHASLWLISELTQCRRATFALLIMSYSHGLESLECPRISQIPLRNPRVYFILPWRSMTSRLSLSRLLFVLRKDAGDEVLCSAMPVDSFPRVRI